MFFINLNAAFEKTLHIQFTFFMKKNARNAKMIYNINENKCHSIEIPCHAKVYYHLCSQKLIEKIEKMAIFLEKIEFLYTNVRV